MSNKSLAIVGTASNVGKSSIAAAIMYYYTQRKISVAPFKALNITANLDMSSEGLPMALSQVIQAKACDRKPMNIFNPVLIKPTATEMEIYLSGQRQVEKCDDEALLEYCVKKYRCLAKENDLVVIEGSGSCTELNLQGKDLANFPLIKKINAPTILVANIENCGIFANVYGTFQLLSDEEKGLIKGIIINKYCGDKSYFNQAKTIIEELVNKPIIGVVPLDTCSSTLEENWLNICDNIDMEYLDKIIFDT